MISVLCVVFLAVAEAMVAPPATIVRGAIFLPLENKILYNAFVPLTFEVILPSLRDTHVPDTACIEPKYNCALRNETAKFVSSLITNYVAINPAVTGKLDMSEYKGFRNKRGMVNLVGEINKFLFGIATEDDLSRLHSEMATFSTKLDTFVIKEHEYVTEVFHNISSYSVQVNKALKNFYAQVNEKFESTMETEKAMTETIYFSSIGMYYESVLRVVEMGLSDCRNQLIPRGFLNDTLLASRLSVLNKRVLESGFEVAVDLNDLFLLKVARCRYAAGKLQVRINIPIRKIDQDLRLYKIISIPFQHKSETYKHFTDECLRTEKLCKIPYSTTAVNMAQQCFNALQQHDAKNVSKNCVLRCVQNDEVIIEQYSSNEFVVANAVGAIVKCSGSTFKEYQIPKDIGALHVTISCGCYIEVRGHEHILFPAVPCFQLDDVNATHIVRHILPPQMSKFRRFLFNEAKDFSNYSKIYNDAWKMTIPTIDIKTPTRTPPIFGFIAGEGSHASEGNILIYIWLTLLSFILIWYGCIIMRSQRTSAQFAPVPYLFLVCFLSVTTASELDEEDDKTFSYHLWTLIQTIEIYNLVIGTIKVVFVMIMSTFLFKANKFATHCIALLEGKNDIEMEILH